MCQDTSYTKRLTTVQYKQADEVSGYIRSLLDYVVHIIVYKVTHSNTFNYLPPNANREGLLQQPGSLKNTCSKLLYNFFCLWYALLIV